MVTVEKKKQTQLALVWTELNGSTMLCVETAAWESEKESERVCERERGRV